MHSADTPYMHRFLIVVQVEAVEIHALRTFNLFDLQDLVLENLDGLACSRLHDEFTDEFPI